MIPAAAPAVALAFLASAAATALLFAFRRWLPLAQPNARSLHVSPIPRVGGIAVWIGLAAAVAAGAGRGPFPLAAWAVPCAMLVVVSLCDDIRSVPILVRLAVHAVASVAFALALPGLPAWGVIAAALACAWSLNLYNFMDGSDGLAAVMSLIGFAAYAAVLAWQDAPYALAAALAIAVVPVLFVNRPPARMFIGDVGAVPLGFMAAALGIAGAASGAWGAWFPLLVFLPFVADASATLLRRVARGERFWVPHKSHYYQKVHQLGAGHRGTLLAWTGLMAGTGGTAVLCACLIPAWGWAALAAWTAAHAVAFAAIDYHWRRSASHEPE